MRHRLRPQRSVSLLHGIIKTAMMSRNSVIVVCTPLTSVCRSRLMSLIITFMFEPAKLQMNWARASGARILRDEEEAATVADAELNGPTDGHRGASRRALCWTGRSGRPESFARREPPPRHDGPSGA